MANAEKLGNVNVSTIGKFELEVRKDQKKFKLTNINSFIPKGKTIANKVNFKTQNGEVESLMINKFRTIFKPDEKETDRDNVAVLIQHPRVYIHDYPDKEWDLLVKQGIKAPKSDFILKNIDKQNLDSFDSENELIEARAVLRSTKNPISTEKLKWLCSNFGISHRSHITESKRYRVFLINQMDKFIQNTKNEVSGEKNLERFIDALENIKYTEMIFYINELKSLQIIIDFGGVYKVGDRPVGSNVQDIINWYTDHPEVFNGHKKIVIENSQSNITV